MLLALLIMNPQGQPSTPGRHSKHLLAGNPMDALLPLILLEGKFLGQPAIIMMLAMPVLAQ